MLVLLASIRMTAYTRLFLLRFRTVSNYRMAALSGIMTQLFWGILISETLIAFSKGHTHSAISSMSTMEIRNYIWVQQATFGFAMIRTDPMFEVSVRTGTVGYELTRPMGLFGSLYSRLLGQVFGGVITRTIPFMLIAMIFLELKFPEMPIAWILSFFGAGMLAALFCTLYSLVLMLTEFSEGIRLSLQSFIALGSGLIVPLVYFPKSLQSVSMLLPFQFLIDFPCRVYLGHVSQSEYLELILIFFVWMITLLGLGHLFARAVSNRAIINGG